jgi:hypothetical protein
MTSRNASNLGGCDAPVICQDAAVVVLLSAVLTAALAGVLAVAGFSGGWIVTAAAGLCVLALAAGLGHLLEVPHRWGTVALVGGVGGGCLVAETMAARPDWSPSSPLALYAAMIAAAVLLAFAHELLRRDGRADVVESVTATFFGELIAIMASGWILLGQVTGGVTAVLIAAAAIAFARLGSALPLPSDVAPWIGVVTGTVAAFVAASVRPGVRPLTAVLVGVGVSAVGVAIDRLLPPHEGRLDLAVLARAAGPVSVAGTVAYAVFRIGVG